jgi:signal transduction histidine kinase
VEVTDDGPMTLLAHEILLSQIVGNLVVNAAQASRDRGTIWVHVGAQGDEAVVEVHDAGPGIPEAKRATVFEALESTKADGNGMGLFSVKACTLGLGGRVEVAGSPRGGACFRVWLPVAPARARDGQG